MQWPRKETKEETGKGGTGQLYKFVPSSLGYLPAPNAPVCNICIYNCRVRIRRLLSTPPQKKTYKNNL